MRDIFKGMRYEDMTKMSEQQRVEDAKKLAEELRSLFGVIVDHDRDFFLPGVSPSEDISKLQQIELEYRVGRASKEANAPVKITVDVPGCTKTDVAVEIKETLSSSKTILKFFSITATRKDILQTSKLDLSVPKVEARVAGYRCDLEKVSAKVENGVLTLLIPLLSSQENKASSTKISVL